MKKDSQSTVLIVDDNATILKLLFAYLQHENFKVLTAETGEAALTLVDRVRPDIILLDILMPGIDGFETCRRLKARPDTKNTPVVFMTALSDSVDKVKGFEVGAVDYITKPFDVPEVVARINTLLTVHRLQNDLTQQNQQLQTENIKRKRVQEALRESRWRYRLLAENSTDLISRQTLKGVFLYVSPACNSLLGYNMEAMIGTTIFDHIHPDDLPQVQTALKPGEECPSTSTVTCRVQRSDDSFIWLEIISRTVCDAEAGEPYEIVSVSRDVTQQVELTAQLRDQNQELNAFAHTVAHDLKNPFGVIVSTVDFLLGAWDRLDETQILNFLRNIRMTGQKGIDIISALLLLASVRQEDVTTEPIDMDDVVAQVLDRLAKMIDSTEARVTLPDEWPAVIGYAPWVEEVWMNYLSNGIKYGGKPPHLELGVDAPVDGSVRFWVKDNGPGIKPEFQSRLFTEFVRLEDADADGHGLGLSIVRRIVNKLGGEVGLHSTPGKGSTFYFTLPAI